MCLGGLGSAMVDLAQRVLPTAVLQLVLLPDREAGSAQASC